MATTPQSRKAKGRRLQQEVRDLILEHFKELEPDDVRSTPMGVSGPDLMLSPKAKKILGISPEMKNQEKISIWNAIEQCEKNSQDLIPILVFKKNRSKNYVALEFEIFISILKELYELKK